MRIIFTINPDANGRITVTNVIKYIRQNVPHIKVPDADITNIPLAWEPLMFGFQPLADLTVAEDNTKHCVDGYASGKKWENGKFIEYEFTLIFR